MEVSIQLYNPKDVISGFQFSITGAEVTEASGGIAEDSGFMVSSSPISIIGFAMAGTFIQRNNNNLRTLLVLNLVNATRIICLDGIIFTGSNGTRLSSNGSDCLITH